MGKNEVTSEIIDGILKTVVASSVIITVFTVPNLLLVLDKPLQIFFRKMDKRSQERELHRVIQYMKYKDLIRGDYEHGLKITDKGRLRLTQAQFDELKIEPPSQWDHIWRIVFYDIPEKYKVGRQALTSKLKLLGFYQLQRSVWIHPFPCRKEIEIVTSNYAITNYVSLVEAPFIDNQQGLIERFKRRNMNTNFK